MKASYPLCALASAAILLSLNPTGESQERPVKKPRSATSAPHLAICSPDGEFFVVVTAEGRITYGRTSDGATLRTFYQCHPREVEFSRDGRMLACVGANNGSPARIKVWNVDNGKLLCRIETEGGSNPLLSFSPDGLVLASTSGDSQINFWQLPEGTPGCSVTTARTISCIAFANDGDDVVAISADGKAQRISVP